MILLCIDLLIVLSSIWTLTIVWQIYRKTKSRAFLLVMLAVLWIVAVRIYDLFPGHSNTTELVVGFWILFPIGLQGLLNTIQKLC